MPTVTLDRALGLGAGGVGAEPGADREPFDPEAVYQEALAAAGRGRLRPAGPRQRCCHRCGRSRSGR